MEKQKKHYYVNVIEEVDDKMSEVMNFNFGGHHDLAAMVEKIKSAGLVEKDKHAKELALGIRFLHHVMKKNENVALFQKFYPQFEEFKKAFKEAVGCECGCSK
ncbi:MAG: DUF3861 domain-containing protein [Muribaculaceae bacterium]|nr:DUF3861 domain-containing protein [Muribaculaceae bacterium]